MSNKSSVRTPTPRPSWERLRPWHLLVGLPAVAAYALAPWLVSQGVPVPGPLVWLAAVAIGVSIAREWWRSLLPARSARPPLLAPLAVHAGERPVDRVC